MPCAHESTDGHLRRHANTVAPTSSSTLVHLRSTTRHLAHGCTCHMIAPVHHRLHRAHRLHPQEGEGDEGAMVGQTTHLMILRATNSNKKSMQRVSSQPTILCCQTRQPRCLRTHTTLRRNLNELLYDLLDLRRWLLHNVRHPDLHCKIPSTNSARQWPSSSRRAILQKPHGIP